MDQYRIKKYIKENGLQLTIVLDEARHLATRNISNDTESAYKNFCSTVDALFRGCKIAFIFPISNTPLPEFNIGRSKIDFSSRSAKKENYLPVNKIPFCDEFKSAEYLSEFQKYESTKNKKQTNQQNLFEFINAREPINTLFYFGRPLWASFEKQLKGKENQSKCQEIIRLARIKIMTKENFRKAYSSLAILGLTT